MAYVYIYYDPRKTPLEPIYVGKGQGKRMIIHKTRAKNPILKRKIEHIKEAGLEPIVEKHIDDITHEEAMSIEMELIAKFGRIDLETGTLCNLTEGGEGTVGRIASEETKKLWSEQRKGKKQTEAQYKANCNRAPVSEETKKKQSLANKGIDRLSKEQREQIRLKSIGRKMSKESREKMSRQRKGKKQTEAQYRANCNRVKIYKKVKCLTNGKIYNSPSEASVDLNLKSANYISKVARGASPHYQGYNFTYKLD